MNPAAGEETIAAISTASGAAGICVVRISGAAACVVAARLFPSAPRWRAGTFFHSNIVDPRTREVIDDAVVLYFHSPQSYTGEDVVEIQGHGGAENPRRLLNAVLATGARPAEPGEFTKRAFLNGKLDLVQAEAVADFIAARSSRAARTARHRLDGAAGRHLAALYDEAVALDAELEHALDFTEDELPAEILSSLDERLAKLAAALRTAAVEQRVMRRISEGALVALCGRPNAGKSSLLNALLGDDRAIVSATAGTTRDIIEAELEINGVLVRLADTAGLRTGSDEIETEGVKRARELVSRADLVLVLREGGDAAPWIELPEGVPTLRVVTKGDLMETVSPADGLLVSARTGAGLAELRAEIAAHLGLDREPVEGAAATQRQAAALMAAATACEAAKGAFAQGGEGLVIAATKLRVSARELGRLLGRTYDEDVLDAVFSRFCVGK